MIRATCLVFLCLLVSSPSAEGDDRFELLQDAEGVTVNLDGQLLTRYRIQSGNKPILWPLIGPHGTELTRRFPMAEALPNERTDHRHQRSVWFTHGEVNGVSFWHEAAGAGRIVHREFVQVQGGNAPVIVTRNDWMCPDGQRLCRDQRTLRFGADDEHVWIDMDLTVTASDGEVTFGDTKEGSFGVRVAGTMKVDSQMGGRIINSEGQTDAAAWGQRAAWCDYHGPVGDHGVGLAIMNHPRSFRFPTYWHVRNYGLFAANPFGVADFTDAPAGAGDHTLQPGESFTLHYRLLIHEGDHQQGRVAEAFARYAEEEK